MGIISKKFYYTIINVYQKMLSFTKRIMTYINEKWIHEQVLTVLAEAGVSNPNYPLNPITVANKLGYTVFYLAGDLTAKDISGAVDKTNKRIFVNPHDSIKRQTFTIAHELGHAKLHASNVVDYRNSSNLSVEQCRAEHEADEFAAQLLMPKDVFIREWGKKDVWQLSNMFAVSEHAIMFRAKKLGLINAY